MRDISTDALVIREGASLHTADELASIFIQEAGALTYLHLGQRMDPYEVLHDDRLPDHVIDAMNDADTNGWCSDLDNGEILRDFIPIAEGWLTEHDMTVVWNDGFVIYDTRKWTDEEWQATENI